MSHCWVLVARRKAGGPEVEMNERYSSRDEAVRAASWRNNLPKADFNFRVKAKSV